MTRPPRLKRPATLFPYTTLFRSRRRRESLHPVSRRHRTGRVAATVRDRRTGRWPTRELPLPVAVLHRGPAVRRGRIAPGWRQGRRGAHRAHGRHDGRAEELTMSQDDSPDMLGAAPKLAPEQVALRAQPRPVTRLNRRMLAVDRKSTRLNSSH